MEFNRRTRAILPAAGRFQDPPPDRSFGVHGTVPPATIVALHPIEHAAGQGRNRMRKMILAATLVLAATAGAATVGGVKINDMAMVGDHHLVLNGAGVRKKLFIKVYTGALYL